MNVIKVKTDCHKSFCELTNKLSDLWYVVNHKISFSYLKFKTIYTIKGVK